MRVSLLFVAALLCACHVDDLKNDAYSCASDADCGAGWRCIERVCVWGELVPDAGSSQNSCTTSCSAAHQLCCNAACVDPATDRTHCGACGNACADGESCLAGRCLRETKPGACRNGIDDDGDGLVDCQDTKDCPDRTACGAGTCCKGICAREDDDVRCSNRSDDDCDGHTDCDADGCQGHRCSTASVCVDHQCREGCFIDGAFVQEGAKRTNGACWVCASGSQLFNWSPLTRGTQVVGCNGTRACDGLGACRRMAEQPCAGPGDCASHRCDEGRCRQ